MNYLTPPEQYLEDVCAYCQKVSAAKTFDNPRVIVIAGPSGSGKTSLVAHLSKRYPSYFERHDENPHLQSLLLDLPEFNAFASQSWFLNKMADFIVSQSQEDFLILDQDPSAIVRVYGRMFRDNKKMGAEEYKKLLIHLISVEATIANWGFGRTTLLLDASPEVLRTRVQKRSPNQAPPIAWFEQVRTYFQVFRKTSHDALFLSTNELSTHDVVAKACDLLKIPY